MKSQVLNIFLLNIIVILSSCTSSLENKSILEPLSTEQQNKLIEEKEYLAMTFALADEIASRDLTRTQHVDYKKLTYKAFNAFIKEYASQKAPKKYEQEWTESYQSKIDYVPEILAHYRKMVENEYPENKYVKVELIETSIDDSFERLSYSPAAIKLRVTPLVKPVSHVRIQYGIGEKDRDVYFYGDYVDRNSVEYNEIISRPIEIDAWLHYGNAYTDGDGYLEDKDFNRLTPAQLCKKYNWGIRADVVIDGVLHNRVTARNVAPEIIRKIWDEENKKDFQYFKDDYYTQAAAVYFKIDIPSKSDYVGEKEYRYYTEFDPLAFDAFKSLKK